MSMRSYPIYGFGLVLTTDKSKDEIEDFVSRTEFEDVYEFVDDVDSATVQFYDAEEFAVTNFSSCVRGADMNDFEEQDMLVFWAEKQPDAFKPAYASKEEAVEEFKGKYGKYFPEDFDWLGHIGYFSAVAYC